MINNTYIPYIQTKHSIDSNGVPIYCSSVIFNCAITICANRYIPSSDSYDCNDSIYSICCIVSLHIGLKFIVYAIITNRYIPVLNTTYSENSIYCANYGSTYHYHILISNVYAVLTTIDHNNNKNNTHIAYTAIAILYSSNNGVIVIS